MTLAPGEINESITVVGQSPTVDMQKTQTGSTFTTELIETLPLSRDLSSIFNSAPGMFARTSHGSDARSNNFIVDGVKMQDPVTGDPYQTVPWNAIDEVEIETSNQKAEYGAVKGALVNVITKAGGNEFSGGVNFYFRDKSLQSDNTQGTPLEGQFVGFRRQFVPGFSLGGPIVKDKLWFFTSLDVDLSSSYIQGFPAPANYGDPQPASAPTAQNTYAPFAKMTWQLGQKDKIVASAYYRLYNWDHRNASRWNVLDANSKEDSAVTIANVQWTKTFTNNFFTNVKAAWYSLHQYILARNTWPRSSMRPRTTSTAAAPGPTGGTRGGAPRSTATPPTSSTTGSAATSSRPASTRNSRSTPPRPSITRIPTSRASSPTASRPSTSISGRAFPIGPGSAPSSSRRTTSRRSAASSRTPGPRSSG